MGVSETARASLVSVTAGMANSMTRNRPIARVCAACKRGVPAYPGRYPTRCPMCKGPLTPPEVEESVVYVPGQEPDPDAPVIVGSTLSPQLRALIEGGRRRGDRTFIPYAFAERAIPAGISGLDWYVELAEDGTRYRCESPFAPVLIFEMHDDRGEIEVYATRDPKRVLGFDPREEMVEDGGWSENEGWAELDEAKSIRGFYLPVILPPGMDYDEFGAALADILALQRGYPKIRAAKRDFVGLTRGRDGNPEVIFDGPTGVTALMRDLPSMMSGVKFGAPRAEGEPPLSSFFAKRHPWLRDIGMIRDEALAESDREMRDLERRAARGDADAAARLDRMRQRAGMSPTFVHPWLRRGPGDEHAATELELYIENTGELYQQRQSIEANLRQKVARAQYDQQKAPKLWLYWITEGARRYVREFGGDVRTMFPKRLREYLAAKFAHEFEQEGLHEARLDEYAFSAPTAVSPTVHLQQQEDRRASAFRQRKAGQGATRVHGGTRFQVGGRKRKPRKDVQASLQRKINAKRGVAKRIRAAREWHNSPEGRKMHRDLGRYNYGNRNAKKENEDAPALENALGSVLGEEHIDERAQPVSLAELRALERMLDGLFANVGMDIEFTRHFFDRVNDVRNRRQITVEELSAIFHEVYGRYRNKIKGRGSGFEAVIKDITSDINVPFVLNYDRRNGELELVAKTIMRKRGFKTRNKQYTVQTPAEAVGDRVTRLRERVEGLRSGTLPENYADAYPSNLPPLPADISQENPSVDDLFDSLMRRLIVIESSDILQDVNFDENGSVYLFFDPSQTRKEIEEVYRWLNAEHPKLRLVASPDLTLEGESAPSDWWVMFLPGETPEGVESEADPDKYAVGDGQPGDEMIKRQMLTMAPPTAPEQIATTLDTDKLMKGLGEQRAARWLTAHAE